VLVLSPTRELAVQIGESFREYGRFTRVRQTLVYGGVSQHPQTRALSQGVHVLVATPGRLLDLMNQGHVRLDRLSTFVLDEADRMLDMGFLPDIRRIVAALPKTRQSLFFSATMPPDIAELADSLLADPVRVAVAPVASTVDLIEQQAYVVEPTAKTALLGDLLKDAALERVLVFTRTKRRADNVAKQLRRLGVLAEAIHGNKSQNARMRALDGLRSGRTRVLVATDVAARGLDVDGISHVVNFDLPDEPENYVHRIGRTGRAGATGVAVSFCEPHQRRDLKDIERLIRQSVPVVNADEWPERPQPSPGPSSRRRRFFPPQGGRGAQASGSAQRRRRPRRAKAKAS
jgi:ATP-dependent RNA helicase RhlE